jgi:putative ABC transport system permease protein
MTRTVFALTHVNLGFNPSNVLVTESSVPNDGSRTADEKKLFFRQVLRNVTSSPGVIAASATASLPPYGGPGSDIEMSGKAHSERWSVQIDLCSDGVFRTLGIRLLRGRLLSEDDAESARRVAVVNETLVHSFFGERDPVGQEIKFKVLDLIPDAPHDAYFEIVGVVNNIRNRGLRDSPVPQAYLPYSLFGTPGRNILVRSAGDPLSMAKQVHDAILSVDRGGSSTDTSSLETYIQRFDYAVPEFGLVSLSAFAGIGLLLASVGIFGVMA